MVKKETILDMIGQVFKIYGFTVICLMVFGSLFGGDAQEISDMFALGNAGLNMATLLQFLGLVVWIVLVRSLFFTDMVIHRMSIGWRTVCMFVLIIAAVGVFAYCFNWFPVNEVKPWIAFFVCFGFCASISTISSIYKDKRGNEEMELALKRLQQEEQ